MTESFFASTCHPTPSRRQFLALSGILLAAGQASTVGAQGGDGLDLVREHAVSPRDPWAVAHGIRAMGRDFTIEGGRRAVDFLLEDHVAPVAVNNRAFLGFPRQVEIHPNSFLKTLLEAGVPLNYGFTHRGQRRTVAELVEGARLSLRPSEVIGRANDVPWSIIALTLTTSPLRARWTNAWGEPVDLDAIVGDALEMLERASAPVGEAMRAGRPLTAREPVHHLTCGGTHLIYSIITAANAGYTLNGRAARVRHQVDILAWRLGADIDLIDRFYTERPPTSPLGPWLLVNAKLKVLGHAEECLALCARRGVATLSASQQAKHQKAVAEVRRLLVEVETRGLAKVATLSPEVYRQIVGDVCHARHGLTLS